MLQMSNPFAGMADGAADDEEDTAEQRADETAQQRKINVVRKAGEFAADLFGAVALNGVENGCEEYIDKSHGEPPGLMMQQGYHIFCALSTFHAKTDEI